jgi:CRISPR Cas6 N-terminal domain
MPYALVLDCLPQNDALIPEDLQGQKTLAFFLEELIQKRDPALAARLHAPRNSKPFTTAILPATGAGGLWPSRGPKTREARDRTNMSSGEVKIRLTLLDDALYPLVSQFFLQHIGNIPVMHLGRSPLIISRVTVTSESGEPWAGFTSFDNLQARASVA